MTKMAEISLNWYPIYDQNIRKTIPFGAAHTNIAHIREYLPRAGGVSRRYSYCIRLPINMSVCLSIWGEYIPKVLHGAV